MERAKITLGQLKEKYQRAVENGVVTIFIGDTEVYVTMVRDLIDDMSQYNTTDDTLVEVGKTNIFDER